MLTVAPTEVGLKLRVPGDAYAELARHPALGGPEAAASRKLYTVYFDTAKHDVRRAGLALRLRRDGASWTQTLQSAGSAAGGLHRRIELDVPAEGRAPDLSRFAPGPWKDHLLAAVAGQALHVVCAAAVSRSTRLVHRAPDAVIEARLDRGRIRASRESEVVCELELKLKSGVPAALYELALELRNTVSIAVEQRSTAERGYALSPGAVEAPARAATIALHPDMTVSAAVDAVFSGVLWHVQANEAGLQRHSDPEYVHQMRVGLRRLRAALAVFRPVIDGDELAPLVSEVRWLAATLGAARDWDVLVETAYAPARAAFPLHEGLEAYGLEFRKRQRLMRRRAQRAVGSARYEGLVLGLGAWLHARPRREREAEGRLRVEQPVSAYAAEVLETRYARMRKRGREMERRSTEELHELRIAAKKLRYAAQFFASLYTADKTHKLLGRLACLQDALGTLNDAATFAAHMEGMTPAGAEQAVAEGRGILLAWNQSRVPLLRREAERAWRALRHCPTFW